MGILIPQVSVIVPVYRDWSDLQRCLDGLARQTYPQDRFEILVVDNAPAEGAPVGMNWLANAVLIGESKPGSYAARNAAVQRSRGDVLAFLDADCLPDPQWLEAGVRCLQDPSIAMVAGRVTLTYAGARLRPAECYEKAFAFRQADNVRHGVSITANLLVRRQVFENVGPFDETLMSGGDFEWTKRATSGGASLDYCPHCVVRHPARSTVSALVAKARRVSTGSRTLYRKRGWLGGARRVLGNALHDLLTLGGRRDMAWRERAWALLILIYLKAIKVQQRLQLALSRDRGAESTLR